MDVNPLVAKGRQIIQSYGGGGFTVAGVRHRGSVLVFPDRTVAWAATSLRDVAPAPLAPVTDAADDIDLLLLGLGRDGGFVDADLRAALKNVRIAVEAMTTAAACRTFNVLLGEERRVAAALLAVE